MQQRRVRLGDIVDDYCPRERRITNHAVVAMIDETVKQTRCTTCDADHEYREGRMPAPRRRKTGALGSGELTPGALPRPAAARPEHADPADDLVELAAGDEDPDAGEEPLSAGVPLDEGDASEAEGDRDEWPVHRPLIRATLPRPEGQTPERKAPDFTFRPAGGRFDTPRNGQRHRHRPMRHAQGQPSGQGRFGGGSGQGQRQGAGHGQGQGQGQRQGNRQGQGQSQGQGGGRSGQGRGPRPPGGGGRKRGR